MTQLENHEVEQAVLHTFLEECGAWGVSEARALMDKLALLPEDFTHRVHSDALAQAQRSIRIGHVPTRHTLRMQLGQRLQGESVTAYDEVFTKGNLVPLSTLEAHARMLRDLSVRRKVLVACRRLSGLAMEGEADGGELLSVMHEEARGISMRSASWQNLNRALDKVSAHVTEVVENKRPPCLRTGIREFDARVGGLPPTLVVVAAMPGVGKSAFWASVMRLMALRGDTSALFSMEDREEWLGFRYLAAESGVDQTTIRYRKASGEEWDAYGRAFGAMREWAPRILVDDRPALRAVDVLQGARHAVTELGAKCVCLDNMTAMRFTRGPRMDLEMQDFLADARAMADELKVPFVVLSHVKRKEGASAATMPKLTDCSETSAFEKLSRCALGLAREPDSDVLTVGVLKHTNGKAGYEFDLTFRAKAALVEEVSAAPKIWGTGS